MREKRVFQETDVPFVPVAWGRTKVLVGTKAGGDADKLYVAITEYLPGMGHLMHAHDEDDEVMVIVSGKGYTLSNGVRQDLVPGTRLKHGVSITDACIAFAQTTPVLHELAAAVRARRSRSRP